MNDIHPMALFRYSVLGPLISRADLPRGELKKILRELAARHYDIPGSRNSRLSEKTIEAWFYAWRRGGIEALVPKARADRGQSKIDPAVQAALLAAKRENPSSIAASIPSSVPDQGRHRLSQGSSRTSSSKQSSGRSAEASSTPFNIARPSS